MANPTRKYIEDVLVGVKAYLDDTLAAKLLVIGSERVDAVPEPSLISLGPDRRNRHPKIEILPSSTEHDYSFDDAPLVFPWMEHTVVAQTTHTAGNAKFVMFTLMRYYEALVRLHEDDDTFGNRFNRVRLGEADYAPLVEDRQNRIVRQTMLVELTCRSR